MNQHFKNAIKAHLDNLAATDELFAVSYAKEFKNIDDCCTYIVNRVKKEGEGGYPEDVIYGYAIHYYDEETIDIGAKDIQATIVVNHKVELTPEEIEKAKADAKQQAINAVITEEKTKLKKSVKIEPVKLSDKDIAEVNAKAKEEAMKKAVADQKEKLLKKAKSAPKPVESQPSLF